MCVCELVLCVSCCSARVVLCPDGVSHPRALTLVARAPGASLLCCAGLPFWRKILFLFLESKRSRKCVQESGIH